MPYERMQKLNPNKRKAPPLCYATPIMGEWRKEQPDKLTHFWRAVGWPDSHPTAGK